MIFVFLKYYEKDVIILANISWYFRETKLSYSNLISNKVAKEKKDGDNSSHKTQNSMTMGMKVGPRTKKKKK